MKLLIPPRSRRSAGQSTVELALMLPLLSVLALGTYDVSRAIRAKNVLVDMSREGASQAQRGPRTSSEVQGIMSTLAATAPSLEMESKGMIYLTEIKVRNGVRTVSREAWQRNPSGPCSQINPNDSAGLAGTVPVADGGSVCIFEVVYSYDSLLLPSYSPQLQATTAF